MKVKEFLLKIAVNSYKKEIEKIAKCGYSHKSSKKKKMYIKKK